MRTPGVQEQGSPSSAIPASWHSAQTSCWRRKHLKPEVQEEKKKQNQGWEEEEEDPDQVKQRGIIRVSFPSSLSLFLSLSVRVRRGGAWI